MRTYVLSALLPHPDVEGSWFRVGMVKETNYLESVSSMTLQCYLILNPIFQVSTYRGSIITNLDN